MSNNTQPASSPLFITLWAILVLAAAPIWIPLAMLASIATGRSLADCNDAANAMSGIGEEAGDDR